MNALLIGTIEKHILLSVLPAAANCVLLFLSSLKFIQTLQQSGYEGRGYISWLKRKDNIYIMRLITVSLLSTLAFLLIGIAAVMFINAEWAADLGFVFYLLFFIIYFKKDKSVKSKVPLVFTNRVKRLCVTSAVLELAVGGALLAAVNFGLWPLGEASLVYRLRLGILCLMPMTVPFLVLAAYFINEPFERYNKRRYIAKCRERLAAMPELIRIGITGSYGKTSIKEILVAMLSEKFSLLATPYSYNTPMGICKTVKNLSSSHEVFIAEMGARNVGDIRELARIVRPTIGVMSGVIGQHIETFGSIENIKKTKYELIEELPPDGFAVFSADNDNSYEMYLKCPLEKAAAGLNAERKPDVYADGVTVSAGGTRFILHVGGESAECATVLLGSHNVTNICLAAAVAARLGLTAAEIAAGINRIKPIKHRLELVENKRGFTIIDDSFNANVDGTIAAMEVLDRFEGRKIVVTPGLVELGAIEERENYELGKRLGAHTDVAVLVGKRRINMIRDGLIAAGFNAEEIYEVKDLEDAKILLEMKAAAGDVIIFENDLPDKYN